MLVAAGAAACGGPETAWPALTPKLEFDGDPESAGFAELRLAGPAEGGALPEVERARLAAWSDAAQAELLAAIVVWTGDVAPQPDCRHPQGQPPVLGRVEVSARGLVFEPRFPWVAGLDYTACLDLAALVELVAGDAAVEDSAQLVFALPAPAAAAPRVLAVWPDLERVPANLLRLYVRFDQPMHRRGVAAHVRLLDASGAAIEEPFVEIPDGLWDSAGRRLTLFLHPGRIKRGVGPRQALGGALRPGRRVTLEIGSGLESVRGVALGKPFRHTYAVEAADRLRPGPDRWTLHLPSAPTDSLRLEFDEPLDREQLATALRVFRGGAPLPGVGTAGPGGRAWSFTPAAPWRVGDHRLEIDRGLEDLAGNTVDRLFDVATASTPGSEAVVEPSTPRGESLRLEFELGFDPR